MRLVQYRVDTVCRISVFKPCINTMVKVNSIVNFTFLTFLTLIFLMSHKLQSPWSRPATSFQINSSLLSLKQFNYYDTHACTFVVRMRLPIIWLRNNYLLLRLIKTTTTMLSASSWSKVSACIYYVALVVSTFIVPLEYISWSQCGYGEQYTVVKGTCEQRSQTFSAC